MRKGRRRHQAGVQGHGLDGRIGNKFLHAGPGYGGSCFPKDTKALARIGQEHAVPMQITETVIKVNEDHQAPDDRARSRSVRRLVAGKTIAVLGVTFKPEHGRHARGAFPDHRARTCRGGAKVRVVDPQGRREGEALLPGVNWVEDAYKAAQNADAW